MIIPKHLQRPDMPKEVADRLENMVLEKRKMLRDLPAYDTPKEAINEAVRAFKKNRDSWPTVWRQPDDMGVKYTVVDFSNRENAMMAGYTERTGEMEIFNMATKNSDRGVQEIEEL